MTSEKQLSPKDKAACIQLAQDSGAQTAADVYEIPTRTIQGWLREAKEANQLPAVRDGKAEIVTGPDWSRAQSLFEGLKNALRISTAMQVLLGQELYALKKEHGFIGKGGDRKSKRNDSVLKNWGEVVEKELGISKETADNWIKTWESAKNRLKKIGGPQKLTTLLTGDPAQIEDKDRAALIKFTEHLVDGNTQKELLAELKLSKKAPTIGGDTSQSKDDDSEQPEITPEQIAFTFFEPLSMDLINLRLNRDYQALLHSLPDVTADDTLCLAKLEQEFEASLRDVQAARKAKAAQQKAERSAGL